MKSIYSISMFALMAVSLSSCVDETSLAGDYSGESIISEFDLVLNDDGTFVKEGVYTTDEPKVWKKGDTYSEEGTWEADMEYYTTCPNSNGKVQCVTLYLKHDGSNSKETWRCNKGWFSWECRNWQDGKALSYFD